MMVSVSPIAMIPRRDSTTGPDSFRSRARSARTRLERPAETAAAWAAGRSMTKNPGFQRGRETGAARGATQDELCNKPSPWRRRHRLLDRRHPLGEVHPVVLQLLGDQEGELEGLLAIEPRVAVGVV